MFERDYLKTIKDKGLTFSLMYNKILSALHQLCMERKHINNKTARICKKEEYIYKTRGSHTAERHWRIVYKVLESSAMDSV